MRWSIRTKILLILSSLLLIVVCAHLFLTQKILTQDKDLLVFDTNQSSAQQLANDLDVSLRRILDKMELIADLTMDHRLLSHSIQQNLAENLFERDPDLLDFQLLYPSRKGDPLLAELVSLKKLKPIHLTIHQIHSENILPPLPLNYHSSELMIENRSIPHTILYLIRMPLKINAAKNRGPLYAQALIDGRSLETTFQDDPTPAISFAITSKGQIFTHPISKWVAERKNLSQLEIVKQALTQNWIVHPVDFNWKGNHYLGVYRKTSLGSLIVVSMIDKDSIQLASRLLFKKTIILSLIIVMVVLLISLFFARTLTTPLLSLVNATHQIAQGNFDTPIKIHTHDETGILATAFSKMAQELKASHLLLEEYNHDLERKVQERTQELEDKNAAIREQQEIMLKSTRLAAVGEIAGQAAHEVLNPLTAMISSLENLIQQIQKFNHHPFAPLPVLKAILTTWKQTYEVGGPQAWFQEINQPSRFHSKKTLIEEDMENLNSILDQLNLFNKKLKTDLGIILSESNRVGRIVDRMRGLSRVARIPTQIEINGLITECIRISEDFLSRFKIKIEAQFEKSSLYILADHDEMRQVFSNLIKNSMEAIQDFRKNSGQDFKHIHAGLIRISTKQEGKCCKITIWDNGSGIPKANQARIFETNFSTKGVDGTGIGLGICRRFVRESGGEIVLAKSEVGKYTEFELTFPLVDKKSDYLSEKVNHVTP